jgi:predicted amidohydrolase
MLTSAGIWLEIQLHICRSLNATQCVPRREPDNWKEIRVPNSRFASTSSAHVRRALERITEEGIPLGRGSRKFCLAHAGRHYPPKLALACAYEFAVGKRLDSEEHAGGLQTNVLLESLGFHIVACICRGEKFGTGQAPEAPLTNDGKQTQSKVAFLGFCDGSQSKRIRSVEKHLHKAAAVGAQILIVPEAALFTTGPFNAANFDDERLLASTRDAGVGLVIGRVEESANGHYRLRADVLDGLGNLSYSYYKHADPSYTPSSDFQSAFDFASTDIEEFPVAEISGIRVGVLICHDIVYPALAHTYRDRIDLLVTISGVSNDPRKWLTFISERARELGVPATHVCAHEKGRPVPGSVAIVSPEGEIHEATSSGGYGPLVYANKDLFVLADLAGPYKDLARYLSVSDRGSRPKNGRRVRLNGTSGVIQISRKVLESACAFQRAVTKNINQPVVYVVQKPGDVSEIIVRARAIENVVPIALRSAGGYRVFNPTRYRQCSSYFDDDIAAVDELRQTGGALFKRIPEIPYRALLKT